MSDQALRIIPLSIEVTGLLERLQKGQAQVSILVRDENDKWVLGQKPNFYPVGIVRMLGGGVDPGEVFIDAARREMKEETGADVPSEALIPLVQVDVTAATADGRVGSASFPVYLYIRDFELTASDDVKGFAELSDDEIAELIERFEQLPPTSVAGESEVTWQDYGKIWSVVHREAIGAAQSLMHQRIV